MKKAEKKTRKKQKEAEAAEVAAQLRGLKINKEILLFTYVFLFVFAAFIGYFVWFQTTQSKTVVNNRYNKRIEAMVKRTKRGSILSNDGTVLAETILHEDGSEERYYPYGERLAHLIGYVDQGKTGIEALHNYDLLHSHQSWWDRFLNEVKGRKDIGDDVVTTIDLDLQLAAYEALGGRKGAVVVLQASTGRILAMVSNPAFDPNTIEEQWEDIIAETNQEANLLNRGTQGLYPPGSTFKIITLLAFIRQYPDTWQEFSYECSGVNREEAYTIRCAGGQAHGHVDVEGALVTSCNGAFAAMGQLLDPVQFTKLCDSLGFQKKLPLALPNFKSSFVLDRDSNPWTIARTAIGQGQTQMTPLLSAMITAAVANDGVMMQPYVVEQVTAGERVVKAYGSEVLGTVMSGEEARILQSMMRKVITDGTAVSLQTDLYEASGKTGTAEYRTGSDKTHAWFTGYAGEGEDCLAVSVIIEGGGTGSMQAAPVAAAVFERYFAS